MHTLFTLFFDAFPSYFAHQTHSSLLNASPHFLQHQSSHPLKAKQTTSLLSVYIHTFLLHSSVLSADCGTSRSAAHTHSRAHSTTPRVCVVWRCGDVVWWCDVVMRWCGDVIWCGDVVMWCDVVVMCDDGWCDDRYWWVWNCICYVFVWMNKWIQFCIC